MDNKQRYRERMTAYEEMGIAAMLPGMQHMITLMQRELDAMRATLARVQARKSGETPLEEETERKHRYNPSSGVAQRNYWARMTPEQRRAEMKRRGMVKKGVRKPKAKASRAKVDVSKLHPRDARSPKHAAWLETMRQGVRKRMAATTPEQRHAHAVKAGRASAAAAAKERAA